MKAKTSVTAKAGNVILVIYCFLRIFQIEPFLAFVVSSVTKWSILKNYNFAGGFILALINQKAGWSLEGYKCRSK